MRSIKNNDGFSLIELLIALTVFAVGLLALAEMQIVSIKGNSTSQAVSAKVILAAGVAEEIASLPGDDPFFGTDITDQVWPGGDVTLDGAGQCSTLVDVIVDPTVSGTTFTDTTQIIIDVSSPTGSIVRKTLLKRRY